MKLFIISKNENRSYIFLKQVDTVFGPEFSRGGLFVCVVLGL